MIKNFKRGNISAFLDEKMGVNVQKMFPFNEKPTNLPWAEHHRHHGLPRSRDRAINFASSRDSSSVRVLGQINCVVGSQVARTSPSLRKRSEGLQILDLTSGIPRG